MMVAQSRDNDILSGYHHVRRMELALSFLRKVIKNSKEVAHILDVGCGDGLFDELVCREIQLPFEIVGMDISPLRIKRAKKRIPNCSFVAADIYHLPFKSVFNVIIMGEVLEHLHSPRIALKKVREVLRQKGHLIIDTPSKSNIIDMFLRLIGHEPTWGLRIERTHVAFYDEESLRGLIRSSGFEIIDVSGVSFVRYDLLSHLAITWNKSRWWFPKLIDKIAEKFTALRSMGAIQVFLCQTTIAKS